MIDVEIYEDKGLCARCFVTGDEDEFRADVERIKTKVPWKDRDFVMDANPKFWRVRNAEQYADAVVEIGDAIRIHKAQLRWF